MPYEDEYGAKPGDAARFPLHAAAADGRLADLGAGLTAKDAEGTLAAGAPCPAQLPPPFLIRARVVWRQR